MHHRARRPLEGLKPKKRTNRKKQTNIRPTGARERDLESSRVMISGLTPNSIALCALPSHRRRAVSPFVSHFPSHLPRRPGSWLYAQVYFPFPIPRAPSQRLWSFYQRLFSLSTGPSRLRICIYRLAGPDYTIGDVLILAWLAACVLSRRASSKLPTLQASTHQPLHAATATLRLHITLSPYFT